MSLKQGRCMAIQHKVGGEREKRKKTGPVFLQPVLLVVFSPKTRRSIWHFIPAMLISGEAVGRGGADEVMWHNSKDAWDARIAASSQWNAGCLVRLRHPQWTFVSGLFVLLQQQRRSTTPFLSSITLFHHAEPFKQWNGISKRSYIKVSGFFETHKTMKG